MRDHKLLIIALLLGFSAFQSFMFDRSLNKSQDQTRRVIAAATEAQEGWRATIDQLKACLDNKPHQIVDGSILHGKVIDEHGITYYLSSEGAWHSNRVVGELYLNDKTQTWEEYKP